MAGRRVRLTPLVLVLVTGSLILLLMAAEPLLASLARQSVLASGGSLPLPFSVAFAVVGFVVAWRKPGNLLGWLILGVAGFLAVSEDASFYAVANYRLRSGALPLGWLALLTQPGWAPAIASIGLIVLLFPDGRLPSQRWHWVLWPYLALALLWIIGALAFTAGAIASHDVRVDSGGNLLVLSHPSGGAAWWAVAQSLSRTLAYALLTGLLIGVYAGLILLATQVLRFSSPVAVAGSTLAAVALFTPVRRRVQRVVDRRFNRAGYNADAAVAAFAARLKGAVNLDSVRDDLVRTVGAALEPAQVSVWIDGGRR